MDKGLIAKKIATSIAFGWPLFDPVAELLKLFFHARTMISLDFDGIPFDGASRTACVLE